MKKKATLLSTVGADTFSLIQSLVAPDDVLDTRVNYSKIIETLNDHFEEPCNFMSPTFEFYSLKQGIGQPFKQWLAELRSKARYCGFNESCLKDLPLERALRDAVLMGTNSNRVKENILKKKDPTLAEVIAIAKDAEMVDKESK